MSGRFVSGGTISSSEEKAPADADGQEPLATFSSGAQGRATKQEHPPQSSRSAEWEIVEKQLAEERQRREEQRRKAATGEEKSLYDILQENKAAKQAAFEEQNRIRNQFRALDDDEADFLDEVRERKRKADEAVKRETEEGLQAFRKAQNGGEDKGEDGAGEKDSEEASEEASWGVGRKRRRGKEREKREVKGVRRKVSANEDKERREHIDEGDEGRGKVEKPLVVPPAEKKITVPALGLGDYGSDSE